MRSAIHQPPASTIDDHPAALADYERALLELRDVLAERHRSISCYELARSGFVPTLLASLKQSTCRAIFSRTFGLQHSPHTVVAPLIRQLVALFESHERLPVYAYDAPGAYNLQAFVKRFKLVLANEEASSPAATEIDLLDFSGRVIRVEPLANVSHLERYLVKMVAKQWYDYDRSHIYFLRWLAANAPVTFAYASDFDRNGLLYFAGTNGLLATDWANPHAHKHLMRVSMCSSGLVAGRPDDLVGRTAAYAHTAADEKRAWFVLDLGMHLIPSHYTLRHSRAVPGTTAATRTAPRNWTLLMSKTGGSTCDDWQVVSAHH
jgi:E3 ubiquitin-protein ligase HECTD1